MRRETREEKDVPLVSSDVILLAKSVVQRMIVNQ